MINQDTCPPWLSQPPVYLGRRRRARGSQLRRRLDRLVDLLDDSRGPVGAYLGEAAHVARVKAEGDDGVAAAGQGLCYHAGNGIISGFV